MILEPIDWSIIVAYLILSLGVGLYFARRASRNGLRSYSTQFVTTQVDRL